MKTQDEEEWSSFIEADPPAHEETESSRPEPRKRGRDIVEMDEDPRREARK